MTQVEASKAITPSHGGKLTDSISEMKKTIEVRTDSEGNPQFGREEMRQLVTGPENPDPNIDEHCAVGEVEAAMTEVKNIAESIGLDNDRARLIHERAEYTREVVRRHVFGPDWEARDVLDDELEVDISPYSR